MKIIFFGSSKFAVPSLNALLGSGHKVVCAVTQPDKQKGRGLHFAGTAVKEAAKDAGVKVYQPQNINSPDSVAFLKSLSPDLFVVIAYGQILSSEVLNIPRIFPLNIHSSLLPRYRGAAPINWAIIKGEKITGITLIKMTEKMDAGPIISQNKTEISNDDNAEILTDRLSLDAAQLLLATLPLIEKNNYNLIPQKEEDVTFAPKLKKEDARIEWNKPAYDIYNLVRGCFSWPGAFTYYNGKLLKIYRAQVTGFPPQAGPPSAEPSHQVPAAGGSAFGGTKSPGDVAFVSKEGILVGTGEGGLIIEELQIEGKRRMKAEEFIAGHKIRKGESFGLTK